MLLEQTLLARKMTVDICGVGSWSRAPMFHVKAAGMNKSNGV